MKKYLENDITKAVSVLVKAVEVAINKGVYTLEENILIQEAIDLIIPGYLDERVDEYLKQVFNFTENASKQSGE